MAIPGGMMPGGPGGFPGGGPPGAGGPPGPPAGGDVDSAYAALQNLVPKSRNPNEALGRVDEALNLIHRLILAIIPQIMTQNPKAAKEAHRIGQSALSIKSELKREAPLAPPPDMMLGMGGGGGGTPAAPSLGAIPGGAASSASGGGIS